MIIYYFFKFNNKFSAAREHKIIRQSQKRKEDNLRRNTKKPIPYVSERVEAVIKSSFDD